jgi:SAM-dependent methyltransferase
VLGKKGRLWKGLLFFHRVVNSWRFWPAGILPLPAQPASRRFAFDRGTPIDRYFIGRFLERNAETVHGRVLEVGDRGYTQTYGGKRVTRSDVLHVTSGNPEATIVGDLATGKGLPRGVYDCLVLTQTLHVIYDVHSAVKNIYRLLKPGGVALVTIPGITPISRFDAERWGDFWRMTPAAAQQLFTRLDAFRKRPRLSSVDLRLCEKGEYSAWKIRCTDCAEKTDYPRCPRCPRCARASARAGAEGMNIRYISMRLRM